MPLLAQTSPDSSVSTWGLGVHMPLLLPNKPRLLPNMLHLLPNKPSLVLPSLLFLTLRVQQSIDSLFQSFLL